METLRATFRSFKGQAKEGQTWRYADVLYETARGLTPGVFGGTFPSGMREGDWFLVQGTWKEDVWNGKARQSFKIRSIRPDLPVTAAGARELLLRTFDARTHGITDEAVKQFVQRHGDDAARKIESDPNLLLEMSRNPAAHKDAIFLAWGRRNSGRAAVNLMTAAEMSPRAVEAVLEAHRDDALRVIKTNPYLLASLPEVGFPNADKLGRSLGVPADDPRRVTAALADAIYSSGEGHTYTPLSAVTTPLQKQGIDGAAIVRAVQSKIHGGVDDGSGITYEIVDGMVIAQRETLRNAERSIAKKVAAIMARPMSRERKDLIASVTQKVLSKEKYSRLDDIQKAAVANSAREGLAILTGGPGTGKSTVTEAIADIAEAVAEATSKGPLILLAPTGKAARRLSEATGRPAETVHRGLKAKMTGGRNAFGMNAENRLPAGCFVVVDEASMLDTETAAALLEALPDDGRLLLVGDRFQLPSVGPGYVLGDMLSAEADNGLKVPSAELINVYRQGKTSAIATGAKALKNGEVPPLDSQVRGGVALFEYNTPQIVDKIVGLVRGPIQKQLTGFDPRVDVAILCPQAPGPAGTWEINARLSAELNPNGAAIEGVQHGPYHDKRMPLPRVGDRVMLTKNDAENEVMNGDVGTLQRVHAVKRNGREARMLEVRFDSGQVVDFPVHRWHELSLAYAITGHKSQGSQYPIVIMPVTMAHAKMLERTLIYTEWTRAKEFLFLVGEREALELAAKTVTATQRQTRLKALLQAEMGRLAPRADASDAAAPRPAPARRARSGFVASPQVASAAAGLEPSHAQPESGMAPSAPAAAPARRPRAGLVAAPQIAAAHAGLPAREEGAPASGGDQDDRPAARRVRRGLVAAPQVAAAHAGLAPALADQPAPDRDGDAPPQSRPRRRGLVAAPVQPPLPENESYDGPRP